MGAWQTQVMSLSETNDSARYARQIALAGFGAAGQTQLAGARVAVIGLGGLGCAAVPSLAGAGVGTLRLIDHDVVAISNLHRQTLFAPDDVGRLKTEAALDHLARVAPGARVEPVSERFDVESGHALLAGVDLVVDGVDDVETRRAVDAVCAELGIAHIWGAIDRWDGQVGVAWAPRWPTYRDLYPRVPAPGDAPACADVGVLPTTCAVIGSVMAAQVIAVLTGTSEALLGRLLLFEGRRSRFTEIPYGLPAAPVHPAPDRARLAPTANVCAEPARPHPTSAPAVAEVSPVDLEAALDEADPPLLVDVREPWEVQIAALPDALAIPLAQVAERARELPSDRDIVLYCHHGVRSRRAATALAAAGVARIAHLAGGIDAWSRLVDPDLPRY